MEVAHNTEVEAEDAVAALSSEVEVVEALNTEAPVGVVHLDKTILLEVATSAPVVIVKMRLPLV